MTKTEYHKLLEKYEAGLATPQEEQLLYAYYNLFSLRNEGLSDLNEAQLAELQRSIKMRIDREVSASEGAKKQVKLWPRIRIAVGIAAAVAAVVFGVWFFSSKYQEGSKYQVSGIRKNDVAPGKSGATITLANGKVIRLSGAKTGVVIAEDKMVYNDGSALSDSEGAGSMMLSAMTSRGQTYQFTLPDGTKVWLNADSKIEFPSNFMNSKTRNVKLTGEAYFAVVHNAKQPFKVESEGQVVEDIGTEFNINAYVDERGVKTTLVEGSAKVNEVILKPNQQSIVRGNDIKVQAADTELAVAWKNGLFQFYRADLKTVMKELARWYNVEVEYQGVTPDREFTGKIFKDVTASQALKLLKDLDVKFKIEGKKITVTP